LLPEISLALLDATAKKSVFLQHVVDKLGLSGVEIVVGRAETIAREDKYREKFGLVLARAVAEMPALVELTLPFCALGGRVVAQKKGDIAEELRRAQNAVTLLGGELREVKAVDLPEFQDKRSLVVIDKVQPTPEKYPRRPGMPEKRPIV
jgi:16S rRNA (guanine527-N7)-methyltransferase